jgi:heme-degrading monooxygenase HmoA
VPAQHCRAALGLLTGDFSISRHDAMKGDGMILETAILNVKSAETQAFEVAMHDARGLIAATPGFQRIEVRRCVEVPHRYLLLVWWDTLEAHTIGFRQSERYQAWRARLHHFYEPFPEVEHYGEPI